MKSYVLVMEQDEVKKKYEKKYKCPYCNKSFVRKALVTHIDKTHQDMIPEGYTALRIVFNIVNNKTEGHCVICKDVTAWNEKKGRYERLCGKESCKEAYMKQARKRMEDVYGTDCVLKDPRYKEEMLKKMLANRKISGKYVFQDGGEVSYVGQNEKKLLEFCDKIMMMNSYDIIAPGPVIYYKYAGQERMYISDFYYYPYNLVIEVKDGGDRTNPRVPQESRDKQISKEDAIRTDKKYNYIRVSNNEFSKFMEVLALIKYTMEDDPEQMIVMTESVSKNESMAGVIGSALAPSPLPKEANPDNYYMVVHNKDDVYDYSITRDPTQTELISIDPVKGKVVSKMKKEDNPTGQKIVFKMKNVEEASEVYKEAVQLLKVGACVDSTDYFYRKYRDGRRILTPDQLLYDEAFEWVPGFDEKMDRLSESVSKYIFDGKRKSSSMIDKIESDVRELGGIVDGI